jgi:rare lipoprotein A
VVRINDRGPFKKSRIIDLSKKAAQRIDMHSTMKVRVQYLRRETEDYLATKRATGKQIDMFAYNDRIDNGQLTLPPTSISDPADVEEIIAEHNDNSDALSRAKPVVLSGDDTSVESISSRDLDAPQRTAAAVQAEKAPVKEERRIFDDTPQQAEKVVVETKRVDSKFPSLFSPPPITKEKSEARKTESKLAQKKPEQEESVSAKTVQSGYYVQAGSFSSRANADRRAAHLSGIYTVITDKVTRLDKDWWRVRLGPFASKQDADAALQKVRDADVSDAHVMHEM